MLSNNLPEDVMEKIIVRLPVKSLLQFQRVAKSWYTLITNPSFIARHPEWYDFINKSRYPILIICGNVSSPLPRISLISKDKPNWHIEPLPHKIYLRCHGQIKGIFCLHVVINDLEKFLAQGMDVSDLILWNPTTKEDKIIPKCPRHPNGLSFNMFGFGFDSITKDYKVVQVPLRRLEGRHLAELYNFSTNSWRTLDVVVPISADDYHINDCKSYLNGVYHWYINGDMGNGFILSFNFTTELFGKILLPSGINSKSYCGGRVFVLNGSLAVLERDNVTKICKIWVMNEYGVGSSWDKKFETRKISRFFSILGSWGENEILIRKFRNKLISYNLQNHHIHRFKARLHGDTYCFDHVPSLVPLAVTTKSDVVLDGLNTGTS